MSGHSTYQPTSGFGKWMDDRLPLYRLVHDSFVSYPVPRNLNNWYTFGGILSIMLVSQIVTGIILAMHYTPEASMAFESVHALRRDVSYGGTLQGWHAVGSSMFFVAVYIHIFRGLYYGSYKAPREILWILGVVIFLLMMATSFMGYVLPWGQMSYWGAQVITSFFSAIPLVGDTVREFLLGGYAVGNATLNRFFSLHYLLPFMIAGVVILHVWALHVTGQTNPTGVEVKSEQDYAQWLLAKKEEAAKISELMGQTFTMDELYAQGEKVYQRACLACHGANGEGGVGPAMAKSPYTTGDINKHLDMVINGSANNPAMQAFGNQFFDSSLK